MLAARESQCTYRSGVREVAGRVNSKSCTATVPDNVCAENVPPATPLKVAVPFTRNGRLAGPPSAVTSGLHSSRLEVETERCSVEDSARVPEACTLDAGVDTWN